MAFFEFETTGRLELFVFEAKRKGGRALSYQVLFLEEAVRRRLEFQAGNRFRFDGEFEGHPVSLAWLPAPGRGHYAIISTKVSKALGLKLGDEVSLRFNAAKADHVELPPELSDALAASAPRRRLWQALTPGRQRGLCHLVVAAKRPETKAARIETIFEELRTGVVKRTAPPRTRSRS